MTQEEKIDETILPHTHTQSILALIATISYGFKCLSRISVFGKMGVNGWLMQKLSSRLLYNRSMML